MSFLQGINVSASGLTAQRLRMDTIASNISNVESSRVEGKEGPYRRKVVIFEAQTEQRQFKNILHTEMKGNAGVKVKAIRELGEDEAPFRRVYEPGHPDADKEGYVNYPNVNIVEEMINMISASRAYEANTKVIDATRGMAMRALEIGR